MMSPRLWIYRQVVLPLYLKRLSGLDFKGTTGGGGCRKTGGLCRARVAPNRGRRASREDLRGRLRHADRRRTRDIELERRRQRVRQQIAKLRNG